jgi:hypothetical protein
VLQPTTPHAQLASRPSLFSVHELVAAAVLTAVNGLGAGVRTRAPYTPFAYLCTPARARPRSQGVESPSFSRSVPPSRAPASRGFDVRLASRPVLLAPGRCGVRTRLCFLLRAASPAMVTPPPPPPTAPVSVQVTEPRVQANVLPFLRQTKVLGHPRLII